MRIGNFQIDSPAIRNARPARDCVASKFTRVALLIALLSGSPAIRAQSAYSRLGMPEVHSSLGHPLWIKIPIEATETAAPISASRFTIGARPLNAGIPFIENAEFSFERIGTRYFLVIRSRQPVDEPAVGVVVREQVLNGIRSREFTLLLDPAPLTSTKMDARAIESAAIDSVPPHPPLQSVVAPSMVASQPVAEESAARYAVDASRADNALAPRIKPARKSVSRRAGNPAGIASPIASEPGAAKRASKIRSRTATAIARQRPRADGPTLRLSQSAESIGALPAASEETRAELRRRQLTLDTDDLTSALLERHHRIGLLEKELVSLAARVAAAERALRMDHTAAVAGDAASATGGSAVSTAVATPPAAETAKPVAAAATIAAPPIVAPSIVAHSSQPISTWKLVLAALAALSLAGAVYWLARRYLRARDESFRILPQQVDDYVAEVLAQSRKRPVIPPAVTNAAVKTVEIKAPDNVAAAAPSSPEIDFELPPTPPALDATAHDKPGIEFDLSLPAANEESNIPPDDIRARRMRFLQNRYQDIAILKPPLDAHPRLLSQAGRIHDEGAAEFAKRLLKYAAYSRPHTEEYWLALLELLYREKSTNDYLVNAKWFRQYHPASVHWDEVQRIGYLLDPGEPTFASAAAWSHEEPATGVWLPANQTEASLLTTRSYLKLELAN